MRSEASDSYVDETLQRIQQLEMDKVIAIQNENYDLASHLKK